MNGTEQQPGWGGVPTGTMPMPTGAQPGWGADPTATMPMPTGAQPGWGADPTATMPTGAQPGWSADPTATMPMPTGAQPGWSAGPTATMPMPAGAQPGWGADPTATMPMPTGAQPGWGAALGMGQWAPQPVQPLLPPEVTGDDLVNVRPLGAEGGFSNLFRAHKVGLDVDVVVKRVKKNYHGQLNEQSEAHIMTALRHQYLPRIYDLKVAGDGFTYTIMELIEGCTLRDYVKQRGCLDQVQALKWTRQLCEAIDYMHTRPKCIIHSDIKPENIMITPQGDICVIDFNASLELEEDGGGDAIGATRGFAAPEQYNRPLSLFAENHPLRPLVAAAQGYGKVTVRTDVYAIGAIAYYMLTGYDPKAWADGIIPLEKYQIKLGDAYRSVVECAMQPRPQDRYKTVGEMLRVLTNLKKVDSRYRSWVWQCRIAALVVGLGLTASILCVFAGVRLRRDEQQAGYLNMVQQAVELREAGDYDQCQALLLEAINMDSDRIDAYLELGAMLYRLGEYSQAIDLMDGVDWQQGDTMDAAAFGAAQGQVYYILGCCHYQLAQYADALTNYQLAVSFLPDQMEYQRDLAICYAKTGNKALAEDTLAELERLNAPAADLALTAGEIAYAYGNYEEAYHRLVAAAESAADTTVMSRAYIQAANACQALGPTWVDQQIQLLETACTRLDTASSSIPLQMLSEAYLTKSTQSGVNTKAYYEKALNCLNILLDRGYRTFAVRQNAAVVLQYLDRFQEAEQMLQAMLQDYPVDYRVPMRLALLVIEAQSTVDVSVRNYKQAYTYWEQAQKLYKNAAVQDGEMLRLQDMINQLNALGWN